MKRVNLTPIIFLFVFFTLSTEKVIAGAETHGGGALVCRNSDGTIKSDPLAVEFLDLWEGTHILHLTISRKNESIQKQVQAAMRRLLFWDRRNYDLAQTDLKRLLADFPNYISDPETIVAPPSDVYPVLLKKGCDLEGVAVYDDRSEKLLLNPEIIRAMTNTDTAALLIHEAVCRASRRVWSFADTTRCRRIVSFLFSDVAEDELQESYDWRDDKDFLCTSTDDLYDFRIFEKNKEHWIHFNRIDGNPLFQNQNTKFNEEAWKKFFSTDEDPVFFIATGEASSKEPWTPGWAEAIKYEDPYEQFLVSLNNAADANFSEVRCIFIHQTPPIERYPPPPTHTRRP